MLPNPQTFPSPSNGPISGYSSLQANFNNSHSFSNQQGFLTDHSLHQGTDPNSPAVFRQNIRIAQENVARLQNLARSTLAGIQNAYHPGNSPAQTEANMAALKQTLQVTVDLLWQTGVGALPLLPLAESETSVVVPTEEHMMADVNQSIQAMYEKLKRSQDSAAVVANLLGAPEHMARAGR